MSRPTFSEISTELLAEDRQILAKTRYPIVTVSASFRDVVEGQHHLEDGVNHPDVVFSRAHYSMALGVAQAAWGEKLDDSKAWLVDPSNYVTKESWRSLASAELAGRVLARYPLLNWVKQNVLDRYGRKKLPFTNAITEPLLYLCQDTQRPIISMHIGSGNILAPTGKKVVQVVTDPHVRPDYVQNAHLSNMVFCVFDEETRESFLRVAEAEGRKVDPKRIIVTGPPIDPKVLSARDRKTPSSWKRRPLRLLLTTGGLGTNKAELEEILRQLLPLTRRRNQAVQIAYYAGTNKDHEKMVRDVAKELRIPVGDSKDRLAKLRLWYADDIVTANQMLLKWGFPWADIVYTKPSGDMAYDAVGAGCALMLLEPWGEWERVISSNFQRLGVARVAERKNAAAQLESLLNDTRPSWLETALERTRLMPPVFMRGCANILAVARKM